MAVPRPVILAVLGVALISAVFLLMHGSQSSSTVTPAPAVQSGPAVKAAPKPVPHPAARPAAPAKPAHSRPAPKPSAPAVASAIQPAVNALESGKVVVLFFSGSEQRSTSADDAGTRAAVDGVARLPGIQVVTAGIGDLSAYRPLLAGVAVSQVPAVVVMRAGGKARLIEGFVDAGTLRQTIADELG